MTKTMMRFFQSLLPLLSLCSLSAASEGGKYTLGSVPKQPVRLNQENFRQAIEDPANPLWLLKFFAPWCGHCKKLAPVLDRAAEKLEGQMAIGLIDCTSTGKPLCTEFDITGYPTLKFSVDGDVQPYPSGRSERDILAFGKKMSSLAVAQVNTVQQLDNYVLHDTKDHLAFVLYDPQVSALSKPISKEIPAEEEGQPPRIVEEQPPTVELLDKMQTTPVTQAFASVARKEQAFGHFLLLDTLDEDQVAEISSKAQDQPFVCRVEKGFPTQCFDSTKLTTSSNLNDDLWAFVKAENVPTINAFGPRNFNTLGTKGRPLVIGVVDDLKNKDMMEQMKNTLTEVATSTPFGSQYYFGWFPGVRWAKFLEQFNIEGAPEIFVLDVPTKMFWQDKSYKYDLTGFLQAIADGKVEARKARKKGVEGVLDTVSDFMAENSLAVSIGVIAFLFFLFIRLALWASSDDDLAPAQIKEEKEKNQ